MGGLLAASALAAAASVEATAQTGGSLAGVITTTVPDMVASVLPSAATTTQPITSAVLSVPAELELTSAFAGALAGALAGVRLRFDLTGIATLAVVSGLGGGIIRDVLLEKYGVYALENPRLLLAAMVAALIGFFFFTLAERLRLVLFVVDAIALGLFACIGSDKALLAGLTLTPAILLGGITAVGGGVLRDLLADTVPEVLRPGGFYASIAVIGSMLYVSLADWLHVVKPVAVLVTVGVVLALRLMTHLLGWRTPEPTDLTPFMATAPRRVIRSGSRVLRRTRRGRVRRDS